MPHEIKMKWTSGVTPTEHDTKDAAQAEIDLGTSLFEPPPMRLLDCPPTAAQTRACSRLARALALYQDATNLLWDTDLQEFRLPPLSPSQVVGALAAVRGLVATLGELETHIEDALTHEPEKEE